MKVVSTNDKCVCLIMVYMWGMKVVQRTVSYAPGGRSLSDVNAKTKVTARDKIYSIPADKKPKKPTTSANFSDFIENKAAKLSIKKI